MAFYCKDLLHGNGCTRWFDKSLTCVIYENGKVSRRGNPYNNDDRLVWLVGEIPDIIHVIIILDCLLVGARRDPLDFVENTILKLYSLRFTFLQ